MKLKTKKFFALFLASVFLLTSSQMAIAGKGKGPKKPKAKNVILMISDGQGFNHMRVTNYYTGITPEYENFGHKFGMQTNSANNPAGYDAAAMAAYFDYAKSGYTDSASAATAMYSGTKIYDGQVNMTTDQEPLATYFEMAAAAGKSIGAVSSVQLSHATPAAVYGHNSSRSNYAAIGYEGVYGSNPLDNEPNNSGSPTAGNNGLYDSLNYYDNLKVLMGAGSGDYDDNGVYDTSKTDRYLGGDSAWADITDGIPPNGWTFVQTKEDFEKVADGTLNPEKLLGVAQVNGTLQQSRANGASMNTNVPTLETMTKAALNVLDNNPEGFAVMIEGGAVDWAGHANQLDRVIEEQTDFNNAVQAVIDYLDNNTNGNNWGNTLLIVTADHETGHLWGDGTGSFFDVNSNGIFDDGTDYAHVTENGMNALPGAKFHSGDHTNSLVPLFAKGARSEAFNFCVEGRDPNLKAMYDLDGSWNGKYIDNTCVYQVMMSASFGE
jgi:alkaline phosphatase